jgi:hypothetical protein
MSDDDNTGEEWLATDDPTNGELPVTEFIGTKKDLEQTQADDTPEPELDKAFDEAGDDEAGDDEAEDKTADEEVTE